MLDKLDFGGGRIPIEPKVAITDPTGKKVDVHATKSRSMGWLTSDNAGELETKESRADATGQDVAVKMSSSDTVVHNGPSQATVNDHSFRQLREKWEKKGDMIPAGMFHW